MYTVLYVRAFARVSQLHSGSARCLSGGRPPPSPLLPEMNSKLKFDFAQSVSVSPVSPSRCFFCVTSRAVHDSVYTVHCSVEPQYLLLLRRVRSLRFFVPDPASVRLFAGINTVSEEDGPSCRRRTAAVEGQLFAVSIVVPNFEAAEKFFIRSNACICGPPFVRGLALHTMERGWQLVSCLTINNVGQHLSKYSNKVLVKGVSQPY